MSILKKLGIFMTAALIAMSLCAANVSAANAFDGAKAAESGKKYSGELTKNKPKATYKITVPEKGKLSFAITSETEEILIKLYNKDAEELSYKMDVKSGHGSASFDSIYYRDSKTGVFKGTLTYEAKAGTYYLQLNSNVGFVWDNYYGKYSFSVKIPDSGAVSEKTDGFIMTVSLEKGDTLSLGAEKGGKPSPSVKWSSSDSKAVKVSSKGEVTALKAGTAVITCKSGGETLKIKIIVE